MTREYHSRSEFEAWFREGNGEADKWLAPQARHRGQYNDTTTDAMWDAWQASRTAALEKAAKVCEDMHDEDRPSDYAYAIRALAGGTKEE